MRHLLAALAVILSTRASAIELAIEENKAARGSVGTVDMRRVFKAYPETQKAKAAFETLLRQAEEQLAQKKAALLRLRHELSDLKAQRDLLSRTPLVVPPAPAPAAPPPGLQLPGMSTAPASVLPPGEAPAQAPPVAVSTGPAPATAELDAKIALKAEEVAAKDADHKAAQAATERDLLDLESRRTEVLLGQIHRAIQEVAREERISVVVDKSSVLYGHDAVDLTEKVLKRLKGP